MLHFVSELHLSWQILSSNMVTVSPDGHSDYKTETDNVMSTCKPYTFSILIQSCALIIYELRHSKTYTIICAANEDSDQSTHQLSLFRDLAGRCIDSQQPKASLCAQERLTKLRGCAGWSKFWQDVCVILYVLLFPRSYEPSHDKTNKMACAPSEDSDQPGPLPVVLSYLISAQSFCWFCHEAALMFSHFCYNIAEIYNCCFYINLHKFCLKVNFWKYNMSLKILTSKEMALLKLNNVVLLQNGSKGRNWKLSRLMEKATKWPLRPAKTQISLGIRPVWSESSLCAQ